MNIQEIKEIYSKIVGESWFMVESVQSSYRLQKSEQLKAVQRPAKPAQKATPPPRQAEVEAPVEKPDLGARRASSGFGAKDVVDTAHLQELDEDYKRNPENYQRYDDSYNGTRHIYQPGLRENFFLIEARMQNLMLDGSVNLQICCNIKLSHRDTKDHTIWVKARVANNVGQIGACIKHLYVNSEGKLHFHINGFGTLYGRTQLNDGREHAIAVRHTIPDLTWTLYIDGKEECRKVIPQRSAPPERSEFRMRLKTTQGSKVTAERFYGLVNQFSWSMNKAEFDQMLGIAPEEAGHSGKRRTTAGASAIEGLQEGQRNSRRLNK